MTVLIPTHTTLAILAGGRGRRMGGPKHRLAVRGVPMLRHITASLDWPGPTLLVLAEGDASPEGSEGYQRTIRDHGVGAGPLRAIASALEASRTPALITMPVDMPGINQAQLRWVVEALSLHPEAYGILLSRGSGEIEPFPAIFRPEAASDLRAMLGLGRLAVRDLATEPLFRIVPAPEAWPESTWKNLNEPRDLPGWVTAPG